MLCHNGFHIGGRNGFHKGFHKGECLGSKQKQCSKEDHVVILSKDSVLELKKDGVLVNEETYLSVTKAQGLGMGGYGGWRGYRVVGGPTLTDANPALFDAI